MSDPLAPQTDGHTLLTNEDIAGLRLSYISTRDELNEAEQANIADALARLPTPSTEQLLDDKYLRDLHRSMFGRVWKWAGMYRVRELNIGIEPTRVAVAVRDLTRDARVWVATGGDSVDQLAARFHHRLVQIHPFVNGNGRHGRAATDLLLRSLGAEPFSWGAGLDVDTASLRRQYINALRAADAGNADGLLAFVRR